MTDVDLASIQPVIFILAFALIVGAVWSLIRGAFQSVAMLAFIGVVVYVGLWWWTGQQPIVPSAFGAWLDDLPDTIGTWIETLRDTFT